MSKPGSPDRNKVPASATRIAIPNRRIRMDIDVQKAFSRCTVFVVGMDMNCPACGVLVHSGERHECGS